MLILFSKINQSKQISKYFFFDQKISKLKISKLLFDGPLYILHIIHLVLTFSD